MPISLSCKIWKNVIIHHKDLVNLYGCIIGGSTQIGPFVEIQKNVVVGEKCKISSHSFICEGVKIEDEVFIGHGVVFINDLYPSSVTQNGDIQNENDWQLTKTTVMKGASIGSNSTILGGVIIGEKALIGAGAIISRNVPDFKIVIGNDNRIIGDTRNLKKDTK